MSERLRVCISPCPNDTFAFHGLLAGRVDPRGFELEFAFADVQDSNRRLAAGEFDLGKASFAAALALAQDRALLSCGAALGFGVGPLLLGRSGVRNVAADARVLCPGADTTAALLFRLFHAGEGRVEHVVFSDILPALERGDADCGVCIHEGRFTWQGRGLERIEDLGERWEARARAPLPLGGILARRALGRERCRRLALAIGDSIDYSRAHRDEALATMRAHAQELSEEVLWKHVELYVNAETRALSGEGRRAIAVLSELARASGWIPGAAPGLEIWGDA